MMHGDWAHGNRKHDYKDNNDDDDYVLWLTPSEGFATQSQTMGAHTYDCKYQHISLLKYGKFEIWQYHSTDVVQRKERNSLRELGRGRTI
jgi:hypothetical protein